VNDRALSLLEQYDIEVLRTRKGRGTFICDTKQGLVLMKEYTGHPEKLKRQQQILQKVNKIGLVKTEEVLPNKEGQLWVKDNDGVFYIVKTYFEGSECNIYDMKECMEAMRTLAKLHESMERAVECLWEEEHPEGMIRKESASPLAEYEKHNRELLRIWSYLKKKGQKQIFETRLLGVMEYFVNRARNVTESWRAMEDTSGPTICHGDYQYHNIIRCQDGWHVLNFEKMLKDGPMGDVYLFMRKVMEKNSWQITLGKEMLSAYDVIRIMDEHDRKDLYHRFAYPEKFWKIANFYYNSGKAWIPEKNLEKLEKVISQEKEKQAFLREIFGG